MWQVLILSSIFVCDVVLSIPVSVLDFNNDFNDIGQPLFLTPLLEEGRVSEAQQRSRVGAFEELSFSGYFTVNKQCDSNLFFWFFPAQQDSENAPVVLWLQGGPGGSSLYGLFHEVGPLSFDGNKLSKRNYTWSRWSNLLVIDQPVGTGYSFSGKNCLVENEEQVGRDLYSAIDQFYQLFPTLRKNKFFISGESYAGHYIPSLGYTIHQNNNLTKDKINLSGMMIVSGWMDALYQNNHAEHLYQLGLIDDMTREESNIGSKVIENLLSQKDWIHSLEIIINLDDEIRNRYSKSWGYVNEYNYLQNKKDNDDYDAQFEDFLNQPQIKNAIHVINKTFAAINLDVYYALQGDFYGSVKQYVEFLLEHYPIMFFHGQMDLVCEYPLAVRFFNALQWSGSQRYRTAERKNWCVGEGETKELAGFYRDSHNFREVMVRNAGHMVPADQPHWSYVLAHSFVTGTAIDTCDEAHYNVYHH